MKRFLLLFKLAWAFCMAANFMTVAHAQDAIDAEQLVISDGGLDANLSVQTCDAKNVVLISWKNTNSVQVIAALTVKRKDSDNVLFAVSVILAPEEEKAESCVDVDVNTRSLDAMSLNDLETILILPNN